MSSLEVWDIFITDQISILYLQVFAPFITLTFDNISTNGINPSVRRTRGVESLTSVTVSF